MTERRYKPTQRILIMGGAGSHWRGRLLAKGHDVLRIDNFFTRAPSTTSRTCSTNLVLPPSVGQ